ncbi:MAG: hypothetical protein ACXW1O_05855 [Halobacteriota archaeon]
MKAAKRNNWKSEALPSKHTTIALNRQFSLIEMRKIRAGLVPQQMEDKWFVFWERDALYFHRSWTGHCLYVVRFVKEGDSCVMIEADVNRDPEQYKETSDERDANKISYLIDVLLLRQYAVVPSNDPSIDRRVIIEWGLVGRAMFGQHPYDKSYDDRAYFPICNKCVHYHRNLSGKTTCDIHLDRIPPEILTGDETCDQWRSEG